MSDKSKNRLVEVLNQFDGKIKSRKMGIPEKRDEREYARDLNRLHAEERGMWVEDLLIPYHQIQAYKLGNGFAEVIAEMV